MKDIINAMVSHWNEIVFALISAAFAKVAGSLRKERQMRQCLKSAICALLRDRIIGIYDRYSGKEYFPVHERENLMHLTNEYYQLGGNGVVRELEEKLSRLPTGKSEGNTY